jgi:hypothetical protein
MTELKRYKWANLEYHEGRQYSKWLVSYTDTEAISVHTYQNRKGETKSYTDRSPYYLANGKVSRFTPPGTIGGCDTETWTNEKWLNTAPTSIRRIKK